METNKAFVARHSTGVNPFIVSWSVVPGRSYDVESADDLPEPFQTLSSNLIAPQGVFSLSYTDYPASDRAHRFYRITDLTSPANLLARFQFNGNVLDIGPKSLATTPSAITYTNDSKEGGQAAQFNGTNSFMQVNGTNPISGSFSVAFWLKTAVSNPGNPGDQWFNGAGLVDGETPGVSTDWGLAMTDNNIAFGIGGGSMGANVTIHSFAVNDGDWHQVVATWDRSTRAMTLYVDGLSVASGLSNSNENRIDASALTVGRTSTANNYYSGLLDDIQIYDRALTANDVSNLHDFIGRTLH